MTAPQQFQPLKRDPSDIDSKSAGVNPSIYADIIIKDILQAIPTAIQANRPINEGFMAYNLNVENLEILVRANSWMKEPEFQAYEKEIDKFVADNQIPQKRDINHDLKISKYKFSKLLAKILKTRGLTGNVQL